MSHFDYRFIHDIRDKIVGVACRPHSGGLMMRLGMKDFDFEAKTAPKLESLDMYLDTISDKPELRSLEIHHATKIREINVEFISMAIFLQRALKDSNNGDD